jgi:hypothetical protein
MKKILLASTILAATAGFAVADNAAFSFTGKAYTGIAFSGPWDERGPDGIAGTIDDVDANGNGTIDSSGYLFQPEVTASFTVAMMTTTDDGLEAGASIEVTGNGIFMENDHTEGNFGLLESKGGTGDVKVYLSGDWGKFEAAFDGYTAGPPATAGDVDFTYTNSFGDFDIMVWYEYVWGVDNDEYGVQGTYNFADYSIYAGVEYQEDIGVSGDWEAWIGGTASMNGFSVAAEAKYRNDTSNWRWKASGEYTVDAFTFGAFIEDDDNGPTFAGDDDFDYGVHASYDLGGGVSVDASYTFDQDQDNNFQSPLDPTFGQDGLGVFKLGVSMAF